MLGVPYKGSAPAISDTIGGQTQFMFPSLFTALPHVKSGKLRALAVAGPKRSPLLPDVPTLKEAGVDGVDVQQWYGFFAPAKTPKPIIDQLNKALNQVLADKEIDQAHRGPRRRCRDEHARAVRRAGQERAGEVEGRRAAGQADCRVMTQPRSAFDAPLKGCIRPGDGPRSEALTCMRTGWTTALNDLQAWIGRSETVRDTIGATPVKALNATLDHPTMPVETGTPLPPLWHWLYFLPLHRQSEIGPDGHAKRGGFLPPVPLPRRMWAGSQFEFRSPVRVGDAVERTSTIADVSTKEGRTGKLVFVKVRHEVRCNGSAEPAIVEFHDIVYREAKRPGDVEPPPQRARDRRGLAARDRARRRAAVPLLGADLQRPPHPLRPQVRDRGRGLPGPDRARPADRHLLMDLLRRNAPDADVATFRFKAVRPTFDLNPFRVNGQLQADGKTVRLWAQDHEGWLTMDATATLR